MPPRWYLDRGEGKRIKRVSEEGKERKRDARSKMVRVVRPMVTSRNRGRLEKRTRYQRTRGGCYHCTRTPRNDRLRPCLRLAISGRMTPLESAVSYFFFQFSIFHFSPPRTERDTRAHVRPRTVVRTYVRFLTVKSRQGRSNTRRTDIIIFAIRASPVLTRNPYLSPDSV